MHVLEGCVVFETKCTLVTMNFCDESWFSVRLFVWSPPSSLALSRVSDHDFVSSFDTFVAAESVC